jgi:MFS family permease
LKPAKSPRPTWKTPAPYGHQGAIDSAGTTAAPLLAGFTITLIGLVINRSVELRWPDIALLFLTSAAVCLLVAVQCAYSARQYVVTPAELEAWWPDHDAKGRWEQIRGIQFGHAELFARWVKRFRISYHAGILFVLAAITVVLIPKHSFNLGSARAAAVAVAALGTLVEALWIAAVYSASHYRNSDPERLKTSYWRTIVDRIEPPTLSVTPPDLRDAPERSRVRAWMRCRKSGRA